jgi:hypothetical protein
VRRSRKDLPACVRWATITALERIAGIRTIGKCETSAGSSDALSNTKVNLLIDIQNSIKAKNSPGYEQWVKVFNLKQTTQTLIYLQENDLTDYNKLEAKAPEATKLFNGFTDQIKEKEVRLNEISSLQKHISNYSRTRNVYVEYRKAGYSKKFLAEHEGDIILHQASKKVFDELGLKKLPTIKTLQTEYAAALAEKKNYTSLTVKPKILCANCSQRRIIATVFYAIRRRDKHTKKIL